MRAMPLQSIDRRLSEMVPVSSSKSQTSMRIKLHVPTFGEEEIAAAVAVMRSTMVTSGTKVKEFESHFGPNAVMCNSGSSANLLAIAALCNPETPNRLEPGDEVIVSALSWSTTVWPLVQHGLIPKIVDIDLGTLNIDPAEVEKALGPKTRAIMPVHVYGNPCEMEVIERLARDHGCTLIEDCCEALGAVLRNQPVGSWGHLATFSFYFSHHITTLEGGMVTTKHDNLDDLLRILRAHGWTRDLEDDSKYRDKHRDIDPKFLFVNAGYNLRTSELNAAIGLVQLPKLPGFVETRREAARMLIGVFGRYAHFLSVQQETPGGKSSWFGFPVIVGRDAPFEAKALRTYFERHGIETRAIICGNIARQPGMQIWPHVKVGSLKNADHVMTHGFSIGCHQGVDAATCGYVGRILDDFMGLVGCD